MNYTLSKREILVVVEHLEAIAKKKFSGDNYTTKLMLFDDGDFQVKIFSNIHPIKGENNIEKLANELPMYEAKELRSLAQKSLSRIKESIVYPAPTNKHGEGRNIYTYSITLGGNETITSANHLFISPPDPLKRFMSMDKYNATGLVKTNEVGFARND